MTFLASDTASAREASQLVRTAWSNYKTPVNYGLISVDLPKVAAMIAADLPTRLYYTAYRRNAFDTHVQQGELHQRLLSYVSDAASGFMQDMQRIGRADDVTVLVFSEFGRRAAPEHESGHRPWHGQPYVRDRQASEGSALWQAAEPRRAGCRRQCGAHHRFSPRLCQPD